MVGAPRQATKRGRHAREGASQASPPPPSRRPIHSKPLNSPSKKQAPNRKQAPSVSKFPWRPPRLPVRGEVLKKGRPRGMPVAK